MSLLDAFDLIIGIDTEYVSGENLDGVPYDENAVLSYQAFYFHPATGKSNGGCCMTNGPGRRHRRRLTSLIERVISGMRREGIDIYALWKAAVAKDLAEKPRRKAAKQRNLRIALVVHFARADFPSFSDFTKLKKHFDHVRGTFVSIKQPTARDLRMPNGARIKATLTLFDTKLLAPAGAGRLKDLGNLVGLEKLEVPEVVDENGNTVPGITRMDLVEKQYPEKFEAYAVRDPEVTVLYFRRFAEFAEGWELKKIPPTVAAAATMRLRNVAKEQLPEILGRELTRQGRIGEPNAVAQANQARLANAYHGGRNEAFVHGIFTATPERPFVDYDVKGCYTTAMAPNRDVDWAVPEYTTDLKRLAVLEDPTVATVDFEFPKGTRFPCLPVAIAGGLVFPRTGRATVTGPELLLAVTLKAQITVQEGLRFRWVEPDMEKAPRPFRDFAEFINNEREKYEKGSVFELLAKECGNSIYGKLGQGVGEMKSIKENRKMFDTRTGLRHALPPSAITSPLLAAMASGIPRAVVGEILSRLPAHVRVLSVTTDGWISDASEEEIHHAIQGQICRWFAKLRATVDSKGSSEILEAKHRMLSVLIVRTRGGMTVEPLGDSGYFLARAGHRLENSADFDYDRGDKKAEQKALAAECAAFFKLIRERTYDTELEVSSFISMSKQWEHDSDFLVEHTRKKVALCFDMKRMPVNAVDAEGMIRFETEPWDTVEDYKAARDDLDSWKQTAHRVLKHTEDWLAFQNWRPTHRRQTYAARTQFENAVVIAWAQGLAGFSIRKDKGGQPNADGLAPTKTEVARLLTKMGVPNVSSKTLDNASRRESSPIGTVSILHAEDELLFEKLLDHTTTEGLESLLNSDLRGLKGSKREQTESVKTTEEPPQTISLEESLVKRVDIIEEIHTVENREKEPPQSDMGELSMRRFFSTRKAAENVSQTEQMQRSEFDASLQPTDESRGIASVGLEKAPAAGPSPAGDCRDGAR